MFFSLFRKLIPVTSKILLRIVALAFGALSPTACVTKNYGDDKLHLQMASHGKDVMWVPTKIEMAHEMLAIAKVVPGDIVYDLGSGDGVIPIEAAKKYKVRAVGIEYNRDLVELSKRNAERAKVVDLVELKQGDIFVEDFSKATVLTLYLGNNLNLKLKSKILKMQPGTRVVSNTFHMESWTPDQQIKISNGEVAYLWIVPANIDGAWRFTGLPVFETVNLQIVQKKQFFDGTLEQGSRRPVQFEDGRIRGNYIEFEFMHKTKNYTFKGELKGSEIIGFINNDPNLRVVAKR
jgi:precorrin-6B methylase 2